MAADTVCQAHSGVHTEVEGLKDWKRNHDEVVHVELNQKVDRPQAWVTWAMTGMGTMIGFLTGILAAMIQGGI